MIDFDKALDRAGREANVFAERYGWRFYEDLKQEAALAVCIAADRFKPEKQGECFESFAHFYIKGRMTQHVLCMGGVVSRPRRGYRRLSACEDFSLSAADGEDEESPQDLLPAISWTPDQTVAFLERLDEPAPIFTKRQKIQRFFYGL